MNKLQLSKTFMLAAIILVAGFQCYWLNKLYKDEWKSLQKETDVLLKNTVQQLQNKTLRMDSNYFRVPMPNKFEEANIAEGKLPPAMRLRKMSLDSVTLEHLPTSSKNKIFFKNDSTKIVLNRTVKRDNHFVINQLPIGTIAERKKIDSLMALAGKGNIKIIINTDSGKHATAFKELNAFDKKIKDTTVFINGRKDNFINASIDGTTKNASAQLKSLVLQLRTLYDSIPVKKVDSVYQLKLAENKIVVPHHLKIYEQKDVKIDTSSHILSTGYAEIGFNSPYAYKASFANPLWFILKKLSMPIVVSFLLIIITTLSFVYLYRNLAAQQRLALIKDEFISNITHELKTPIATVNVAIEALKSFGGIDNPQKTKEYLNISSAELQRLSLLVDKVLKLSMFESKAIALNKESFDIKLLVEEVMNSMKLQIENQKALVELIAEGNYFLVNADKLHLTSVLFNLLDNALKYSKENPDITIKLQRQRDELIISIKDNGIGIATEYQHKVFDKFFRVPSGGHHNVKGYGLGLSYVAEIIKKHNGTIAVESEKGNGSNFIIQLPLA